MRSILTTSMVVLAVLCCGCPTAPRVSARQACQEAGLSDATIDVLFDAAEAARQEVGPLTLAELNQVVTIICNESQCTHAESSCLVKIGQQELVR